MATALEVERAREALLNDTPLYAEECLRIVNKDGDLVPLVPKPPQLKLDRALEAQRLAGKPMRAIILKSRQWGGSTWTAAKILQKITQLPNRKALVVAHKDKAAQNLFSMYETMYAHLPDDPELPLKPTIANTRRQRLLYFANKSVQERFEGNMGLNSFIMSQTAGDVSDTDADRSFTYHFLHYSECAMVAELKSSLTSLLQTVPDKPGTLIVLESTAKGHNHFKDLWDAAEDGTSDYAPVFVGWHEDPDCWRPFDTPEERAEFVVGEGQGPDEWYEDEPGLVEQFGLSLEQLHWRRWAIVNRCQKDVEVLHQEYPATPEEAFLATGRQVFSVALVKKMLLATQSPQGMARFEAARTVDRKVPGGTAIVPTEARVVKGTDWLIWEKPQAKTDSEPAGQYIITIDPADETEDETEKGANHAIEVGNHRTGMQVAEYVSKADADLVAQQAYLAALLYAEPGHKPWIVVETTGGYGVSIAKILWQRFRYPFVYQRKPQDAKKDRQEDRLGWSTNVGTKPLMIDGLKEVLREGAHGVRSAALAREFLYYVRNERGKMKPETGKTADRLMAWAMFQQVRHEKPLRSDSRLKGLAVGLAEAVRNPVTGY